MLGVACRAVVAGLSGMTQLDASCGVEDELFATTGVWSEGGEQGESSDAPGITSFGDVAWETSCRFSGLVVLSSPAEISEIERPDGLAAISVVVSLNTVHVSACPPFRWRPKTWLENRYRVRTMLEKLIANRDPPVGDPRSSS